jgi:hypothetical protein
MLTVGLITNLYEAYSLVSYCIFVIQPLVHHSDGVAGVV